MSANDTRIARPTNHTDRRIAKGEGWTVEMATSHGWVNAPGDATGWTLYGARRAAAALRAMWTAEGEESPDLRAVKAPSAPGRGPSRIVTL